MTTTIDLTDPTVNPYGLEFSAPKRVNTKMGERDLRKAAPTEAFWGAWRADKQALRNAGFSLSKDDATGAWTVMHWGLLPTEEREERAASRAMSRAADADIDVPAPEGLSYLPYQRAGIAYALGRDRTLIGDEMGLGKTIQAAGVANAINARSVLVVCPGHLRFNWERELFGDETGKIGWLIAADDLSHHVVQGRDDWADADVIIINYDVVADYRGEIDARHWDLVVIDESHYAKNEKAGRTVATLGRRKTRDDEAVPGITGDKVLLLTGTPEPNNPVELWTACHYCAPQTFSSFWSFAKRYCGAYQDRYGWQMGDATNTGELQRVMREQFMVRRLKADVLKELPAKRRQVAILPRDAAMNRAVAEIEAEVEGYVEDCIAALDEVDGDAEAAYVEQVMSMQVGTAAFDVMTKIRHKLAVAKVDASVAFIKNMLDQKQKVGVFCHHRDVADALAEGLEEYGVAVAHGGHSVKRRQEAVNRFQSDDDCRVIVGTIMAAGTGFTMTAASDVVMVELDWVPGNVTQAEDRVHRIGQHDSVNVYHLVIDDSIEVRLAQAIIKKQDVIDRTLDVGEQKVVEPDTTEAAVPEKAEPATADVPGAEARPDYGDDRLGRIASTMTDDDRALALTGLRTLAEMDDDRATEINGVGFNKLDGAMGHSLARRDSLSPRQAAVAARILAKYRRQIGAVAERMRSVIEEAG